MSFDVVRDLGEKDGYHHYYLNTGSHGLRRINIGNWLNMPGRT